jgi:alpha-L-fucosidase
MSASAVHPGATSNIDWFVKARYGMFIHYGIYSQAGRGEWVVNRERLSRAEMRALAGQFAPTRFDAGALCDLALAAGMRYVTLTTMHLDGFRLYDTELSDFNAKHYCGRDLVAEFVEAARQRGLKIALYHSLTNWFNQPDAVDALESKDAYEEFIGNTFARIKELVTRFNPIDVLWYDGWWPFNAVRWRAVQMNAMVRSIQPGILLNGRNGLDGDFGTPEGHMTAPRPWRPWEACMTLNNHWGYHGGDHLWKCPSDVIGMLQKAASGKGNLLLNVGPRGDGSVPEESERILREVGEWLRRCGECVFDTDPFTFDYMKREDHNGDWSANGPFTLKGRSLYQLVRYWPGSELVIAGLNTTVDAVTLLSAAGSRPCRFTQSDGKVTVTGLPEEAPDPVCPVVRLDCREVPEMYLTGGMRIPKVPHPPYDPIQSDIVD